jgi:hypothetical protein
MNKELKLTPWFPSGINPVRDGVYEVVFWQTPGFARFFCKPPAGRNQWSQRFDSVAMAKRGKPGGDMLPRWRGLAEDPRGA